jgi:pimeloyl-ACP methyl ester carboxylesterase
MRSLTTSALAITIALSTSIGTVAAQATASPPGGSFVAVDGGRLYTEECGSGADVVILIHDGVVHSAVWDDVWPSFCKRFHTIRYDRRGYGRSPATTAWYSETDDIAAILHHAGATRATLIGSSHGGEVSIDFVLAHPDIVRRLILVGAVVGGLPYTEHFIARGVGNSALLRKGDIPGGLKAWSNDPYLVAPGNDVARQKLLALLLANPQDMTHSDQVLEPKPALGRLSEIRVPTLVLVGDADIADVHAHAGAIEVGIPRARRIVIGGVGHLMYLEKPDVFTRTVMSFLDANP